MDQEGLLFPKGEKKKKRMKHPKSILNTQKGICFIMGTPAKTERHHIFGGPNRKHSERYGLTVELCPYCRRESRHSAHQDGMINHVLHEMGQRAFEEKIGSREEFIKIFGKNYLEEEAHESAVKFEHDVRCGFYE